MEQMAAELRELKKQQREELRKEQDARFCKRGSLVEKILPKAAKLDDMHYTKFLEWIAANDSVKNALATIIGEQSRTSAADVMATQVQVSES
jgi:hypothetical protein